MRIHIRAVEASEWKGGFGVCGELTGKDGRELSGVLEMFLIMMLTLGALYLSKFSGLHLVCIHLIICEL